MCESGNGNEWNTFRGGQSVIWEKSMKTWTSGLTRVCVVKLPGWGPRGPPKKWLETIVDMAWRHRQWCTCIGSYSSVKFLNLLLYNRSFAIPRSTFCLSRWCWEATRKKQNTLLQAEVNCVPSRFIHGSSLNSPGCRFYHHEVLISILCFQFYYVLSLVNRARYTTHCGY